MAAAMRHGETEPPAQQAILGGGALAAVGNLTPVSLHSGDGLAAATIGWPDWRSDDLRAVAARAGHGAALAAAYARSGRRLFELVGGPFAAALVDPPRRTAFAAIDRMATQTMTIADGPDGAFVFATTADGIRGFPGPSPALDPQSIYDFLYFTRISAPATVYKPIRKLLPGQYAWREGERTEIARYWEMPYDAAAGGGMAELSAELRERVDGAVARAIEGRKAERVGAFLSGGVDSSTVVGVLAKRTGNAVHAFSIGFDAAGYDEMAFARQAASHFGAIHHEYYITPQDVVAAMPKLAAAYDEPFANASAVPAYYCARMARDHGIELLLAGDGGDELFAGNARYVRQGLFEIYGRVPAWLRRGVIEPVVFGVPGGRSIAPVRRARSYIEQANIPMPDRVEVTNMYRGMALSDIFEDGAGTVDPGRPLATLREVYRRTCSPALLHRMLHVDLQLTLGDDDLRKVSRTCALAGLAVRFPLLDDDVAALSARVPPRLALKGRRLRYFFKTAYRDFLPPSTLAKSKHGFGLPIASWLKSYAPLEALACDALSSLKRRGIFRPAFVDGLLDGHRKADVERYKDYFGEPIWALTMLELWLAAHEPFPAR